MIINQNIIFKRPKNWLELTHRGLDIPTSTLELLLTIKLPYWFYQNDIKQIIYSLVNNGDMNVFKNAPTVKEGRGLAGFVTKVSLSLSRYEYYIEVNAQGMHSFRFDDIYIPVLISMAIECMGHLIISDIKKEYEKWSLIKNLDVDIDSQCEIEKFLILTLCNES